MPHRIKVMQIVTDVRSHNNQISAIAKSYDREKFELYVCTFHGRGLLHDDMAAKGIPAFPLNCYTRVQYPLAIFKLYFLLKQLKIDILHAHLIDAGFVGLAAAKLARTPVLVLTRHHTRDWLDLISAGKKRRFFIILDKLNSMMADYIFAISQDMGEILINGENIPRRKIVLAHYGLDMESINISSSDAPGRIRQEFSLQESFVICTIGRLDEGKGHIYLFQAARELIKVNDKVKFLLVGEGPLRNYLEELAREIGIQNYVMFAGFRHDVPDILAACDIVVHPTLTEVLSQVMVETKAMGKPLIISDVCGVSDVIKNHDNGIIIPPKNPQAIYDAVLYLMNNPEYAKKMGQKGQDEVRKEFDAKTSVKNLEYWYSKFYNDKRGLGNNNRVTKE